MSILYRQRLNILTGKFNLVATGSGTSTIVTAIVITQTLTGGGGADIDVVHSSGIVAIDVTIRDAAGTNIPFDWENKDINTITLIGVIGTITDAVISIEFN